MMNIEIIPFVAAVDSAQIKGKTVIVIDVLRATSVMITALANGANEIIPVATVEEAREIYQKEPTGNTLLCGERDAQKIEGFHLGNSPLEYTNQIVENKSLILTTTNGTKALNACHTAEEVLIGAFLNLKPLVQKVKNRDSLIIVCSGTQGRFSLDDGLCAALILHELSNSRDITTDDLGFTLMKMWKQDNNDLNKTLQNCSHVNFLISKGYQGDIEYCLQLNTSYVVPYYRSNTVRLIDT